MKVITKFGSFMMIICLAIPVMASLDIYEDIGTVIRSGKAKEIATYFNANVELTIKTQTSVYSKAQAELILKDFFEKNPPKSFAILHKGSSNEGTRYAIGNLTTSSNTFRTTFFVKQISGKYYIQELRFEE
jgi:hypothetical protein